MKIGVFDSGIGGLTVLKEVIEKFPNNKYYYYGDNINMPYGNRSRKELLKFSENIVKFFEKKDVDLIIVACGTVSSTVFKEIKTDILMYDILSPTIKYIKNLDSVAVMATENTINSNIFKTKVQVMCPKLVPAIENDLELKSIVYEYSKDIKDCEYLVLGCTHYPIVSKEILEVIDIKLINMGKILVDDIDIKNGISKSIRLYFSKVDKKLISNIDKIIKVDYQLEELCLNYQK